MNKVIKSVAALLVSLITMLQFVPVFAADEAYKLNMTFNNIATNEITIDGLTTSGGRVRVTSVDAKNKAIYLENSVSETSVVAEGVPAAGCDVVYSIDVMADNMPVNLTFGTTQSATSAASTDVVFFRIINNRITTSEGKEIGTVKSSAFTTITVISRKVKVCDYYINGRKVLSNRDLPTTALGAFVAARQAGGNSCYIDNLRCYEGSKIDNNMENAAYSDETVDIIAQQDFNGDVTYFDNRFCYTSGAPRYLRFTPSPKTNEIVTTRLIDYQSPDRTDYIYMKRNDNTADCYFNVAISMPSVANAPEFKHRYFKMEGDFKADKLQEIIFIARDSLTTGSSLDTSLKIDPNGGISGGGASVSNAVTQGEWFHLLWALNLETKTFDVYVNGKKLISNAKVNANASQFNTFRVCLNYSTVVGDLYLDNFNITGLVKPIVDGVEEKTGVIPTDDNIIDFLKDKIGMHAYGHLLHKDGVKTPLETKGIYDKDTEQYYVTADTLNKAFDLNLEEKNAEISGDISVKADGTVTLKDGKTFKLEYAPKTENGRMYVPVKQFAKDAVGKHVWWFKTGILLFSDRELNIDTTGWVYQNERTANGCTVWNDIDYLNGYLQYIRPDVERLKADYIKTTGDSTFTQHPRLYHNSADFAKMKEKYESNEDPIFTKKITSYIQEAGKYTEDNLAQYLWNDSMRTSIAGNLTNRFVAWGYAYNITGDRKYAEMGFKQFEKLATFPDLNTSHVIDTGNALTGIALGYDWLYNGFTPEQREFALGVLRYYLEVLGDALYGRLTSASQGAVEWRSVKIMNNYNGIVNAGITLAAIATLEYDPDSAFRYIKDSMRSIEYSIQMFPPGGAWMEGLSYLNYVMQSFVPWAANVEKNFGQSYNVMDGQGMDGILDFMVALCGPAGTNQMGDGGTMTTYSLESFFYLSQRYNNPVGSFMRWDDLHNGTASASFYDIAFYDFDAGKQDKTVFESLPKMQVVDGMEVFSLRDNYVKDECDMYFSAHFGTSSGYHQHWDCGTFVLDFNGTRWAYDLGNDSYSLQNELGYPGYAIFRKRVEAHNILVLNPSAYGKDFEVARGNFAPIIDAQSNEYGGYVYANMDTIYAEAPKMTLGYYIDDNMNSVTMRNEFTLKEDYDCVWGLITKGTIEIDGNRAYVTQNGGSIMLEAVCSGTNVRWVDNGNPKPLPTSPQVPEQNKNVENTQLQLMFDGKKGDNKLIIKISPMSVPTKPIEDITFSEWKLPEKVELEAFNNNFKVLYNGMEVIDEVPVYGNEIPKIDIVTEDPEAIVEATYATNVSEKTRIKVWDKNRRAYQMGIIGYYKASGANMNEFNTIPVWDVEVSSTPEAANSKDMMLDNDLLTRWTAMGKGEYAIFDLGETMELDGVAAAFFKGDQRKYYFNIFLSDDGKTWREAYMGGASQGKSTDLEAFSFDTRQKARYIKLEGQGNNGGAPSDINFNVLEFKPLIKKY